MLARLISNRTNRTLFTVVSPGWNTEYIIKNVDSLYFGQNNIGDKIESPLLKENSNKTSN